jgi:hypothetical protein
MAVPDLAGTPDYSIVPTDKGVSYWIAQSCLDEKARHEATAADLLLIPREGFGDQKGPLFPVGTEEFLAFLKGQSTLSGYKVDICISDAAYRELALHGEVLVISDMIVKLVVLPIAIKLLADYIGQHLWSSKEDRKVRVGITVDVSNGGKNQVVKIAYEGPADDFRSAMRSATGAVNDLRTPKRAGKSKAK